jgi:hypothetical protein
MPRLNGSFGRKTRQISPISRDTFKAECARLATILLRGSGVRGRPSSPGAQGSTVVNSVRSAYLGAAISRNQTVFGALRLPFPSTRLS